MDHLEHTPEIPESTDEWHVHSAAEGPAQQEHGSTTNTGFLFMAFLGTVGTVAAVVVLTYFYYNSYTTNLRRSRIETTELSEPYLKYRNDWQEMARDYRWVSIEGEGTIALPLQVAMERVLERYQQQGGSQMEGSGR